MARILVVGCGCRGRCLAEALVSAGHAVRGTTRRQAGRGPIEASGAEAVVADPDRLATLTPQLEGVTLLCWLMGSAEGSRETVTAVNGPRLESMLEAIVDTPVRGVVYEAAGSAGRPVLEEGTAIVRRAAAAYRMPAEVLRRDPADHDAWRAEAAAAVKRTLDA
jgi:nucleoside-diphosphate-sugar epimerase